VAIAWSDSDDDVVLLERRRDALVLPVVWFSPGAWERFDTFAAFLDRLIEINAEQSVG
jgi:hypothetical protein